MIIEEWFQTLTGRLQAIEKAWPAAAYEQKVNLANELFELRQVSDQVVDMWLKFEEKLSLLLRELKQSESYEEQSDAENETMIASNLSEEKKNDDFDHMFRKGEGFYHLRLFHDAKNCFRSLLKESPDWEHGRLYFAYSLLFSDEKEAAMKEFRLLSRSASSPQVIAISYNAIGCILAEEKHWLEATQAFKSALNELPAQREALFNLALCQLYDGEAQDAVDTIEEYLKLDKDDGEAQNVWLRAAALLRAYDANAEIMIPPTLLSPVTEHKPETLREMATLYESMGQFHRAQLCYRNVIAQLPSEGWGWHGYAWNTWMIDGTRRALPLLKKAISLTPINLDFLFTYGWMLLFDGRMEQAKKTFRSILLKDRDHRLAQSGLITAYGLTGEISDAKKLAKNFLEQSDQYVQSLGYYHLGRLAMNEENWLLAEQYLRKVARQVNHFREVPYYLRLCENRLGKTDNKEVFAESQMQTET